MRKQGLILLCVLVLLLPSLVACQTQKATPVASDSGTSQETETYVSATGKVVPVTWAALGFNVVGTVKEISVQEGQQVSAGQILARLDMPEAEAAVAQAEAALEMARAQLKRLEAGPRPVDLRGAQAALEVARESAIAAEIGAEAAKSNVAVAEAARDVAQSNLGRVRAGPTADQLEVARLQVESAKAQLYALQGQRDALGGLRDRAGWDPVARTMYQSGSYEAANGQVMAAEHAVAIAEANLRIAKQGARPEDIAPAEAQVKQARAALEAAKVQARIAEQQVNISQKQVQQAQAQLEVLQAPPREEDLAVARAQVAQAEAALRSARVALEKSFLRAPFAGTVSEVNIRPGEFVVVGMPVIFIGDLSTLRVETTDLDEIDIVCIAEGRDAVVTFDALPGVRLPGKVHRLALKAGAGSGGTTYKAIIELKQSDPRLRWGMTAFVDIATE